MNKSRVFLFLLFVLLVLAWFAPASISGGVVTPTPHQSAAHRHPQLAKRLLLAPRMWRNETDNLEVSDLIWSPDGKWAAYCLTETRVRRQDWIRISLCCIRAEGTQAHRLYTSFGKEEAPEIATWSLDSRRVLFWKVQAGASSVNADGSSLYDISVHGGKERLLTYSFRRPADGMKDDGMMREPNTFVFSPDGKYLLLVRGIGRFPTENKRLARLAYPGGAQRWLTNVNMAAGSPLWSQDSKRIAFLACPDPQMPLGSGEIEWRLARTHLWITDSDGGHQQPLTTAAHYQEVSPRWLPDCYTIRFTRQENARDGKGKSSEWEILCDGTGLRRLRSVSRQE